MLLLSLKVGEQLIVSYASEKQARSPGERIKPALIYIAFTENAKQKPSVFDFEVSRRPALGLGFAKKQSFLSSASSPK
jgi:hypothetical protein